MSSDHLNLALDLKGICVSKFEWIPLGNIRFSFLVIKLHRDLVQLYLRVKPGIDKGLLKLLQQLRVSNFPKARL